MTRRLVSLGPALLLVLLAGCPAYLMPLDSFMERQMDRAGVPGLAVCLLEGEEVTWSGAYGLADVENGRPVTADTMFMLASVSKTVTGTALMQLYEAGLLYLDDDVNGYLPFPVRNPNFPDEPITFRMLMGHAAGIRDNWRVIDTLYTDGDSPIALGDFLREYLVPGGEFYNANRNFHEYAPAAEWNYSNVGATLIGYLVEVISGQPFDAYCEEHIFEPLGMEKASWFLAGLDLDELAVPYRRLPGGGFLAYEHYGYPDYPDGQLRASLNEFVKFLGAYANGGEWNGARILEPETIEEMGQIPFPSLSGEQAHIWVYSDYGAARGLAHSGGDRGVSTAVLVIPEKQVAIAVLMNGEIRGPGRARALSAIRDRLLIEAGISPVGKVEVRSEK